MNNSFFRNGNFTGLSQAIFIVGGIFLMFATVVMDTTPNWLAVFLFMAGLLLAFVGGLSARAQLSGLRVFGEPEWKKAKRTYNEHDRSSED